MAIRTIAARCSIVAVLFILTFSAAYSSSAQTPVATGIGCVAAGTPTDGTHEHKEHSSSSEDHSMDGHAMVAVPFDLFYIDMMIPHHASVIALAEVARYELTHPELIAMAEAILATQGDEIAQLQEWRDAWYPDAEQVSMEAMMTMPGLEDAMIGMDEQMSSTWQIQTFCAAEDFDLAFIDQVIPHHQMAIDTSIVAPDMAEHEELKELAAAVVAGQQAEIETLNRIRAELTGSATPES